MQLDKLFQNESAKNEALEHFRALKDDPDWLFLVEKLIKTDIEEITNEILDPTKEWKEGEEREQKRIRAYWIILSQLPEKLIEALTTNQPDIFIEMDPYFKNIKEVEQDQQKKSKNGKRFGGSPSDDSPYRTIKVWRTSEP